MLKELLDKDYVDAAPGLPIAASACCIRPPRAGAWRSNWRACNRPLRPGLDDLPAERATRAIDFLLAMIDPAERDKVCRLVWRDEHAQRQSRAVNDAEASIMCLRDACRRRRASSCRRRRRAHPRASVALPDRPAIASPPRATPTDARAHLKGLLLRSHRARHHDAGRKRLRIRARLCATALASADPHAHRARGSRRPHRGLETGADDYLVKPSSRANCRCASPRSAPQRAARRGAAAAHGRAFRRIRFPPRARRIARATTSSSASPSASATCCASSPKRRRDGRRARRSPATGDAGNERAVDVQINRLRRKIEARSGQSAVSADGARRRLPADRGTMMDHSTQRRHPAFSLLFRAPRSMLGARLAWVADRMPKGLYARSLLIVILPMVMLQSVVAYVFMERHWQLVTFRLSAAVTQDIAAIIEHPRRLSARRRIPTAAEDRRRQAQSRHRIPARQALPPPLPKPFFSILDSALSQEISSRSRGRSGSTRSAVRTWSKSGSSSTTIPCAYSPIAARPMPPIRIFSSSGWSAHHWC